MENRIDDPDYWNYRLESGGEDLGELFASLGSAIKSLAETHPVVWEEIEVVGLGRYLTVKSEEETPLEN